MDTDVIQTADTVARRSVALYAVIAAAHGVLKNDLTEWLRQENLLSEITPRELRFLSQADVPKKELFWMTWFAEAEFVLLWSIGKLQTLPPPTVKCDTDLIIEAIPLWQSTGEFIRSATLNETQVRVEAEAIYDIHVQVDQALRAGTPIPHGYDKDVVFFRHYALNWIVGYCDQSWDEITPDT